MEEKLTKKMKAEDLKLYYKEKSKKLKLGDETFKEKKSRNIIKVLSIFMFFTYGFFSILVFQNQNISAIIISLLQMLLTIIAIFTSMEVLHFFKNDYKVFFMTSFFLIIPWIIFAI